MAKKDKKASKAKNVKKQSKIDLDPSAVVLRERYGIYPNKPIPDLDMPSAKAYEASDPRSNGKTFIAWICDPKIPVRTSTMSSLRSVQHQGLLPFIEQGAVYWPPTDSERMAVMYERPLGGKYASNLDDTFDPVADDVFIGKYGRILIGAMRELYTRGISHRSLRPDNLFFMDKERTQIVIGDCVTCPPAFFQPVYFETIESSMANVAGRGRGTIANDMYSLGATMLMMFLGRNPVASLSDEELLDMKIKEGSFNAMGGKEPLSSQIVECLKGLLTDNPKQRWNFDTFEMWLGGRRLSPTVTKTGKPAKRGIEFGGKSYYLIKELAHAMSKEGEKAYDIVQDKNLEIWVRRGFGDNNLADDIAKIVYDSEGVANTSSLYRNITVAKLCVKLDPDAPLRYDGLNLFIDGLDTMFAMMLIRGERLQVLAEILNRELLDFWDENQPDYSMPSRPVADARNFLKQTIIGYGVERVLYELNDSLPCQSPLLEGFYVDEIKKVLPALDKAAKKVDNKQWPIDRHVAAYISCHFREQTIDQIDAINNVKPDYATAGMLSLLAVLQWKMAQASLYGLTSWVGGLMTPIIESYHSKKRRKRLEKEIPRVVKKGSLPDLYNLLDNNEERQADLSEYATAKMEFNSVTSESNDMVVNKQKRDDDAHELGQQISVIVSFSVSLIAMTIMLLMRL